MQCICNLTGCSWCDRFAFRRGGGGGQHDFDGIKANRRIPLISKRQPLMGSYNLLASHSLLKCHKVMVKVYLQCLSSISSCPSAETTFKNWHDLKVSKFIFIYLNFQPHLFIPVHDSPVLTSKKKKKLHYIPILFERWSDLDPLTNKELSTPSE